MLLSQQAKLTKLTASKAEISISTNWIGMIQSRKSIIEKAIVNAVGSKRELTLEKQLIVKSKENHQSVTTSHSHYLYKSSF